MIKAECRDRQGTGLQLRHPLNAEMRIIRLNDCKVWSSIAIAEIREIGLSTLQFSTHLQFPVDRECVLQFEINFQSLHLSVAGEIIHANTNQICTDYVVDFLTLSGEQIGRMVRFIQTVAAHQNAIYRKMIQGYRQSETCTHTVRLEERRWIGN